MAKIERLCVSLNDYFYIVNGKTAGVTGFWDFVPQQKFHFFSQLDFRQFALLQPEMNFVPQAFVPQNPVKPMNIIRLVDRETSALNLRKSPPPNPG